MSVWISVQSINGFQKFCVCLTRQYSWLPQFCIDPNCNSSFPKQLLLPFSSVPNFCCFQLTLCLLQYFLASGMTCYLPLLGHRYTGWVKKDAVIMILVSWTHLQSDPGSKGCPWHTQFLHLDGSCSTSAAFQIWFYILSHFSMEMVSTPYGSKKAQCKGAGDAGRRENPSP